MFLAVKLYLGWREGWFSAMERWGLMIFLLVGLLCIYRLIILVAILLILSREAIVMGFSFTTTASLIILSLHFYWCWGWMTTLFGGKCFWCFGSSSRSWGWIIVLLLLLLLLLRCLLFWEENSLRHELEHSL